MQTAPSADERPARNVLIVGLSCATNTLKRVACVTAYSARPVYPSIKQSTQNLLQRNADENAELPESFFRAAIQITPESVTGKVVL
jgi:hypothetical protein